MNLRKKVFKIGKYEIEQWQVILGAIASLLAIISFFRKPKTTAETPYNINVTPADSGSSGGSGGSGLLNSPNFGTANYMDSQTSDMANTINSMNNTINGMKSVIDQQTATINGLNSKIESNAQALSSLNNTVSTNKSSVVTSQSITSTVTTPRIIETAPKTGNHDTSAIIETAGDNKIQTYAETVKKVVTSPPENKVVGTTNVNPKTGTVTAPVKDQTRNTTSAPIVTNTGRYTRTGRELIE